MRASFRRALYAARAASSPHAEAPTLDDLRRYAVARTLFKPTTLARAIDKLGFVQADPIRAPARAQDLMLRHRVAGYRAGDLERRYARLDDRGRLPSSTTASCRAAHLALMHPRIATQRVDAGDAGARPPRCSPSSASAGRPIRARSRRISRTAGASNAWGGSATRRRTCSTACTTAACCACSGATTARASTPRSSIRRPTPAAPRAPTRATALLDLVVRKYAPLPAPSLVYLTRLLRYGAPHLRGRDARRARRGARAARAARRSTARDWYWPADENPRSRRCAGRRARAPARALRPDRLGPAPLRAALGLDLSLRGLHAGAEAQARLLRAAAAVARSR